MNHLEEIELSASERRFKTLTETAPVGIFSTDQNGLTTYVNPRWCEIAQISYEEAMGKGWLKAVHPEDRFSIEESWQKAAMGHVLSKAEYRFLHPDGSVSWVIGQAVPEKDSKGNTIGYIGTIMDITMRKLAEEELAFQHAILKTQQEVSIDGILVVDEHGNIVSFNKHFVELFSLPTEIIEKSSNEPFLRLVTDKMADPEKFIKKVKYLYSNRNETSQDELILKDGRIIERYSAPMFGADNRYYGRVWFFLDITESKKAEKEIIIARDKAQESDKLKTAFLSNLSHEIRTPLNAILGFSELLKESSNTLDTISFYFDQIQYGKDDLLELIENVVFASKIETRQFISIRKEFNLNMSLDKLVEDSKHLIKRNKSSVDIISKFESTRDISIETDQENVIIALRQLIGNAIKYTDFGEIIVRSKLIRNSEIEFSVKDTGTGIDKKECDKIFERFYKIESNTNKLFRGAGIGLTVVKGIAESLGGSVKVKSKVGEGSTFYFRIPVNVKGIIFESDHPQLNISAIIEKWGKRSILIVEDVDTNFKYLDTILDLKNITRFHAKNGKEATEIIKSTNIDLILMDIIMPVMDGYEATSIIKSLFPKIPIIAQTAIYYKTENDLNFANLFNDHLVKPIDRKTMIDILDKFLKH